MKANFFIITVGSYFSCNLMILLFYKSLYDVVIGNFIITLKSHNISNLGSTCNNLLSNVTALTKNNLEKPKVKHACHNLARFEDILKNKSSFLNQIIIMP
jgi:hypothetical protein